MLFALNYTSDIRYLRNKVIEEYDIKSGGYSITISENLIEDKKLITRLKASNKSERQILLGLYIREHKEFTKLLHNGFRKYITAFVSLNNMSKNNVLSVKKDSVTFFDSKIVRTKFKQAEFTCRGTFTSYLKIGKLEFYLNSKTKQKVLKGITLNSFSETLIEEVFTIMSLAEFQKKDVIENYITELRQAYVTHQLTDQYYKELSANNGYLLKNPLTGFTMYSDFPFDEESFFNEIDISYNYRNILMPLFEVFIN